MTKEELENRWLLFEMEKAELSKQNLTPEEYTRKIVELCDKLDI